MGDPAPVDELVPTARRYQHIARSRALERRPDAPRGVRIRVARDAAVVELEGERLGLPLEAPAAAADIGVVVARREAELPARAPHDGLAIRAVHDEIEPLDAS